MGWWCGPGATPADVDDRRDAAPRFTSCPPAEAGRSLRREGDARTRRGLVPLMSGCCPLLAPPWRLEARSGETCARRPPSAGSSREPAEEAAMLCVPDRQGAVVSRARTPLRDFVVSESRLDDTQAGLSSAGETLRPPSPANLDPHAAATDIDRPGPQHRQRLRAPPAPCAAPWPWREGHRRPRTCPRRTGAGCSG